MPETPEAQARQELDRLLEAAGRHVCDVKAVNIHAARGVAIREFELTAGHGTADHLLYWRRALECFDVHLIGLTSTPNKRTFGFFNQNPVKEYGHPHAVAEGVNVNYDAYRIKTEVTAAGANVDARYWLQVLDRPIRAKRDWQLGDDFEYAPDEPGRSVQTPGQTRTIARTLRDRWQVTHAFHGDSCAAR